MKYVLAIVLGIVLAGCSTTNHPVATYDAQWCALSEIKADGGVTLYVYVGTKGTVVIARGPDGQMCAGATGYSVDTAVAECMNQLKKAK